MRSAVLLVLLSSALIGQQAGIQGIVIDASTRAPMPGVHLRMFSLTTGTPPTLPTEAYGALTGKDGRFFIDGMKPASYNISVQRAGFVQVPGKGNDAWNGTGLILKPGERRTDFTIEMAVKAIVSGRVTDENGDPIQRAQIAAVSVAAGPMRPVMGRGQTDERGRFRISGAPGKYYVSAAAGPGAPNFQVAEVRSDGTQPPVYAATYYPAVQEKTAASPVETQSGRETTGIDIRLIRQHSLSIHGVVSGVPAGPGRPFLTLQEAQEPSAQYRGPRAGMADPDGKFAFTSLAPGVYNLWAQMNNPGNLMRSSVQAVHLDAADLNGLELHLISGEELQGTLEGLPAQGAAAVRRTVRLESFAAMQNTPSVGALPSAPIRPDGSFRIPDVFPGKYRVAVAPLPEGTYLKSVRVDAAESPEGAMDLTRGAAGARIKVTLSAGAGSVEGAILNADGKPTEIPVVFVLLAATPDDLRQEDLKPLRNAPMRYELKNLRPGKYRLFAVDPRQFTGMDALKGLFEKADQFEIKEGEKLARDLKLPGREASGVK